MKNSKILNEIPKEGFLKVTDVTNKTLSDQQRVTLMRRGNEFFNNGDIEQARRIFLTIGYTDGLIRIGEYYYSNNRPFEAFKMFKIAPDPARVNNMIEKMTYIIKKWIKEE
ncbi:MAG: hypothetical protein JEY91_19000 [Spirochaetaceae bacterium]|nr:hypothetical protein [Spirochaetaceae bacterium]